MGDAKRTGRAKVYEGGGIAVEWEPSLCIHSAHCVASLPAVFDPKRRPWVDATAAEADAIERVVAGCPSGALRSRRTG